MPTGFLQPLQWNQFDTGVPCTTIDSYFVNNEPTQLVKVENIVMIC